MKRRNWLLSLGMAATLLPAAPALAADHLDGPHVKSDHSTDINDVYSWTSSDGKSLYLAMTVYPGLTTGQTAQFSNSAYYVFHTMSRATVLSLPTQDLPIICGFDNGTPQNISCWINDGTATPPYVYGNPSSTATPLANTAGTITVYAGLRKDMFFFNLDGFNQVRNNVKNALYTGAALTYAAAGTNCPNNLGAAPNAFTNQLQRAPGGAAGSAVDFFKTLNTLAIIVQVPVAVLNKNGPIVSVWAGTYRKG